MDHFEYDIVNVYSMSGCYVGSICFLWPYTSFTPNLPQSAIKCTEPLLMIPIIITILLLGMMGLQQGSGMMSGPINQGGIALAGPNAMLGPNGQPLVGPNGQPVLGPNGQPLQQQGGMQTLLGPNGQPMLGPIQPGQQMGQLGAQIQQPFGNMQQSG